MGAHRRGHGGGNGKRRPARGTSAEPEPATVAVATPLELRASRTTDARFLPRLEALIDHAIRTGELCAFRGRERLAAALRDRRIVLAFRDGVPICFGMTTPFDQGAYVAHSAVVVDPTFRGRGLEDRVKERLIRLSRRRWPKASMIGLTMTASVQQVDERAGFEPVPYCDLTQDEAFWKDCDGCIHSGHLKRNQLQDCHCWAGLLASPANKRELVIPKDALLRPRPGARYRSV